MKDRKLKNVPASIHQRLLNLAREQGRPFNDLFSITLLSVFFTDLAKLLMRKISF